MDFARIRQEASSHVDVTRVVAVAVAYYVASLVGLSLRLPPAVTSVLWPPNAILTAALLLTPRRHWGSVMLGGLFAHLAAQLRTDWPLPLVILLFGTNCAEALIAAVGLRRLSDDPRCFDTLKRFAAFIAAAVIAAPLLSTLADAAVVSWLRGDSYWEVSRNRLPANVLAQLVVTPAAVGLVTSLGGWVRHASVRRWAEATALAICLAVTGWLAFGVPFGRVTGLPISIDTPLVVQLPLVVWAAFRFGPVAVSLVLFAMTFLATWTVVSGGAVSPPLSPERLIFTVQMFLIGVGVTLLGLAALTEERRLSMHAVRERLRFEGLMLEFSRAFVRIPSEQVDRVCAEWLGRIGSFLHLDCVRLFQVVTDDLTRVAEWKRPGQGPTAPIDVKEDFPWILTRIQANSAVVLPNLDALPPDAARDRASLKAQGYNAVLVMPMLADEQLEGVLAFGTVAERAWADELVVNLRLMSEVLANALVRRHTDDALRSSEVMKSAILDSLTSGVAVIDAHGRILGLNGNWTRLVEQSGVMSHSPVLLGDDLLIASSPDALASIRAVLNGSKTRSAFEWASSTTADACWWMLVTTRLNRAEGGAVVTLIEITERRRVEVEAQRSRQVLAHVGRVSTMGELTASLAHQLNQPLTGIMSNAQAARRLLEMLPPDYAEVRGAMSDIVDDARRASEVIQHLRGLMRRGEFEMSPVDVNAVIRDVVGLVGSDAVIRNVTVTVDLDPQPIVVRGDSVQLQQVVLNLIVNALEAITDADRERAVCVRCRRAGPHEVRVVVHDSGTGLDDGEESLVFDPFYTTKPHGMGMGLSIARSIVESHGGSIHASRHQDRGTVFEFSLPVSESAELV